MANLILLLLQSLGPGILQMVKDHYNTTGQILTPEELNAKIQSHADEIINKGQDWLDKHPKQD